MEAKWLCLQKAIQSNYDRSKLFSKKKLSGGQSIILGSYISEAKKQTKTKKITTHHASKKPYSTLLFSERIPQHHTQLSTKVVFISG